MTASDAHWTDEYYQPPTVSKSKNKSSSEDEGETSDE